MYYDTHTHLNADNYLYNLDAIIKEARENRVTLLNVVGFDPKTNASAQTIALKYDGIYATAGLHPTSVSDFSASDIVDLERYVRENITVAVGECGLDYYWHKDTRGKQIEYFNIQIEMSKKYAKPLIIHVRDAFGDCYDVLKAHDNVTGVMHCFAGSAETAGKFLDLGLYISLGGPVTFNNASEPKEVAKFVPLDRLLIETDCPFLTPHPYRGKENKPGYLPLIAMKIAEIKELSVETIGKHTADNGKKLFNLI